MGTVGTLREVLYNDRDSELAVLKYSVIVLIRMQANLRSGAERRLSGERFLKFTTS